MCLQISSLTNKERKRSETFAKWLIDVGDSKIGEPEEEDQGNSWITIPPEYSVDNNETSLSRLINFICDNTTLKTPTAGSLQEKEIVCPKNATTDDVNAKILSNIEGQRKIYLSNGKAIPMGSITSKTELLYPTEYLNTITFPGFPPHELELKVVLDPTLDRSLLPVRDGSCCHHQKLKPTQIEVIVFGDLLAFVSGNALGSCGRMMLPYDLMRLKLHSEYQTFCDMVTIDDLPLPQQLELVQWLARRDHLVCSFSVRHHFGFVSMYRRNVISIVEYLPSPSIFVDLSNQDA
ncbi:DNA helicase [Tanacetum coccineum]